MIERLALGAALLAGAGCSTGAGLHAQSTQVQLASGNYRVVAESVRGSSAGLRVFGIGGAATYGDALKDLRSRALLLNEGAPPRALINLTQDEVTTFYLGPLVLRSEVIVTADVIEFIDAGSEAPEGR